MRATIPARTSLTLVCTAGALAWTAACADTRIAPSYPGTLVLIADDATSTLAEIEPNGGHVRERYDVAAPVAAIATARNGQYAAVISESGSVVVCDLARQGRDAAWSVAGGGRVSGLVFADRRSTLAASFADSGEVQFLGRESGRVTRRVPTGCSSVVALELALEGDSIWALCDGPASLVRFDTDKGHVSERIALDGRPLAFAAGNSAKTSWVALATGADVAAWNPTHGRVQLGAGPVALAADFSGDHVVASACTTGELVWIVDDGRVTSTRVTVGPAESGAARAWPVYVDPDGRSAFVSIPAQGHVVVVDLETHAVRGAFEVGGQPGVIAWTLMRAPSDFESDSDSGSR